MSVTDPKSFPAGTLGPVLSRAGLASLAGVTGALAVMAALSMDYLGGNPGIGPVEKLLLIAGPAAILLASVLRYGSRDKARAGLIFAGLLMQAVLLYVVILGYQIETDSFHEFLFGLVATGFVAQHFLPPAFRGWFFLILSLGGIAAILGASGGAVLIVIGLALIGICHLPVSVRLRAGLLALVAAGLALVRADILSVPVLQAVLPVLGSIFMFRIVIYLYDLTSGKGPKDAASRLSYFFMLPNVVFPFFPVVDFTHWGRSQGMRPDLETAQRGMVWLMIGTLHLILYRVFNYYLSFGPESVDGFGQFLWYAITNFGLYLKISGLFHTILGCLYLFGFALPETHTRFYLSFSFIEFWRRINIFWKDFMQKTVFNPVFTAARRRSATHRNALLIATGAVFVVTWATHAYQWFWLRGTLLLSGPDILFWTLLGIFLVVQMVSEDRPVTPGARALIGPRLLLALRTVATMLSIVVLWSLWSAASLAEWLNLAGRAGATLLLPGAPVTIGAVLSTLAFAAFLFAILALAMGFTFGLAPPGSHPKPSVLAGRRRGYDFAPNALTVMATLAALWAVQQPQVLSLLPRAAKLVVVDLGAQRLSARDQATLTRGYYENLTDVRMINSDLWAMQTTTDEDRKPIETTDAVRFVDDYRAFVLKPDVALAFKGTTLSTNSFGMRDREYALAKPDGVKRIAVVGDSRAMGTGVADGQTFENLIEDHLADAAAEGQAPVEVLNFGVAGYDPFHKNIVLETEAARFAPDVVVYIAHDTELKLRKALAQMVADGGLPGDYLSSAVAVTGAAPGQPVEDVRAALDRGAAGLVDAAYAAFAAKVKANGAVPVWVFLPSTESYPDPLPEGRLLRAMAEKAGFVTIDLHDLYIDVEGGAKSLWVYDWDDHPNARGHGMIAGRLYRDLLALPEVAAALGR